MKYILIIVFAIAAGFFAVFGAGYIGTRNQIALREPAQNNDLGLITEPADGIAPVLAMIDHASTSVDLVMYELSDEQIENALVNASHRGVAVRVLLSRGYYGEPSAVNAQAHDYLQSQGVAVQWTSASFALTHEKTLIIDGNAAMIMTFNLMPQYYATSRDFGVIDRDPADLTDITATFDADWAGKAITTSGGDDLLWSPGSEGATIALINSATSTIEIYNEEMADDNIIDALASAARRGVTVRVDMTYASDWKSAFVSLTAVGVQIRTYSAKASLYIHAKMILVDGREAFIGSQNFSETSQEENRELGIVMTNPAIIQSLSKTFATDWENAKPF